MSETHEAEERGPSSQPFRVLFVCTGNTCRSPMAEAIARRIAEERGWTQIEIASAGVSTLTGLPASEGAIRAAGAHDLDLTDHESAQLTRERVERADLILGMTPSHREAAESVGGEGKTALLGAFAAGREDEDGGRWGVPDPFGGDEVVYREAFESIERMVRRVMDRLEAIVRP